ncbi:GNAT family N-acetyltransferase [Pseudomonas plecoglossicida]|uniref:N-acetyltransferase n=1 Tax=Pseudomonas plecoglossicida TaxID=70775 RepID=A0AAD0QUT1_PSEDL|nr:N-acetyltransferase [Pseudomonas plecoglossicida]AXM95031.1 N-acetyltransferase [Pseudomonas plecoglossicida]EPB94184.1 acetyltransferase [Pseudomonas plecoglossicida NB2011]QLB55780.1 N-acetyltransferase [Pseudomonas plecoglossicida]
MLIRPETPTDCPAISRLTLQAFTDHPHHTPGQAPTEHLIIERLRANGTLALSLVAEDEGVIVGQVSVSPVSIEGRFSGWYGLGPIAVAPDRQGQGIGAALMRDALACMRERAAEGIVLLGEPAYYQRFRFKAYSQLRYPGVPPEYFMAVAFAGEVPAGTVAYDPAFG